MDDARKKLRVCLICVVAAAIIFGIIYYFNDIKAHGSISEGTLVRQEIEILDGNDSDSMNGFDIMAELEGRA